MSVSGVIREVEAAGVKLALTGRGTIKATGRASVVRFWTPVLRKYKPEIVEELRRPMCGLDARTEFIELMGHVLSSYDCDPQAQSQILENVVKDFDAAMRCVGAGQHGG